MQPSGNATIREAYAYCEYLARRHYENFPVASWLLPGHLRPHVAAIYAFARIADDFADEDAVEPAARLARLEEWGHQLHECYAGRAVHPVFMALAETAEQTGLPKQPLLDLLAAFTMDVQTTRFETFDRLLYYCRHSANPVGRMVLHLFGKATPRSVLLSDAICTGLQLTNFWQDVGRDWEKGRMYIPLEDCRRFGYTENGIGRGEMTRSFRELMKFEVDRTRKFFAVGEPLTVEVSGTLGLELRLTWLGGMRILRKIEEMKYAVLDRRPVIGNGDKLLILTQALLQRVR